MSHHILTLRPSDVLFFKDGRPMEGSSAGHGAAWPLPHILDSALHHALRRADFADFVPHSHTAKRSGKELNSDREEHGRHFGSLQSAGPFPLHEVYGWYFPRPLDAAVLGSSSPTHLPLETQPGGSGSSLPRGLHPVVATCPPSKDKPEPWLSAEAWNAYLDGKTIAGSSHFLRDKDIFAAEHAIGIGMDAETGTQDGERIYSASYLRLRESFTLGLVATCMDKGKGGGVADTDLLKKVFLNSGHENRILAGGQQRICTVKREKAGVLPLPTGRSSGFHRHGERSLVKWVLLSPAIFPRLNANPSLGIPEHPGGWLPSWINPKTLEILLKDPSAPLPTRNRGESRADYRRRIHNTVNAPIRAKLAAAIVPKPIPVSGWALTDTHEDTGTLIATGGARATHLAVPAGSVYYFVCEDDVAAEKLAATLNWHGADITPSVIRNRRSTLLGEKGFGLGVCGSWDFYPGPPRTKP